MLTCRGSSKSDDATSICSVQSTDLSVCIPGQRMSSVNKGWRTKSNDQRRPTCLGLTSTQSSFITPRIPCSTELHICTDNYAFQQMFPSRSPSNHFGTTHAPHGSIGRRRHGSIGRQCRSTKLECAKVRLQSTELGESRSLPAMIAK